MKKTIPLIIGFVLAFGLAKSQNILNENIQWNSDSSVFIDPSESITLAARIITYGNSKIELRMGKAIHSFSISKTSGIWDDVSMPGKMIYYTNRKEVITVERTSKGELYALFDLTNFEDGVEQKFIIHSFSVNP